MSEEHGRGWWLEQSEQEEVRPDVKGGARSHKAVTPRGGDFAPRRHFAVPGHISGCHSRERDAT